METGDTPVVWEGLLTAFLSGALSPAAFHDAFLHGWRQARDGATDPAPAAIEDLFYTVEAHRSRIMEKLNLHSIGELVRFAMRHGLID